MSGESLQKIPLQDFELPDRASEEAKYETKQNEMKGYNHKLSETLCGHRFGFQSVCIKMQSFQFFSFCYFVLHKNFFSTLKRRIRKNTYTAHFFAIQNFL